MANLFSEIKERFSKFGELVDVNQKKLESERQARVLQGKLLKVKQPEASLEPKAPTNLFKDISQNLVKPITQTKFGVFEPTSQAGKALESAKKLGEETREKFGVPLVKVQPEIVKEAKQVIIEDIPRLAGGVVSGKIFKEGPKPGETFRGLLARQPALGSEVVEPAIRKIPVLGAIPGLSFAGGFIAESLLPPFAGKFGRANFVKQLTKEGEEAASKFLIKKGYPGITDEAAEALAKKTTPLRDEALVDRELKTFEEARAKARETPKPKEEPIPRRIEEPVPKRAPKIEPSVKPIPKGVNIFEDLVKPSEVPAKPPEVLVRPPEVAPKPPEITPKPPEPTPILPPAPEAPVAPVLPIEPPVKGEARPFIRPSAGQGVGVLPSEAKAVSERFPSSLKESARIGTEAVEAKAAIEQKRTRLFNLAKRPIVENENFFNKLRRQLTPIKNLNETTRSLWSTAVKQRLGGRVTANLDVLKLGSIPKKEGFNTILRYEKGTITPYSSIIKKEFDDIRKEAIKRGLEVKYRENYIPQRWENPLREVKEAVAKYMADRGVNPNIIKEYLDGIRSLSDDVVNALKLSRFFEKSRVFPDYETGMRYGLKPKYTHPGQLLADYRLELEKTLANKKLLEGLTDTGQVLPWKAKGWKAVEIPNLSREMYAEPKLAKTLNDYFRDESNLGFGEYALKKLATLNRRAQELVLSGGVPRTNINFFTIGQVIKSFTTGLGEVLTGNLKGASTELKTVSNFFRSNFTKTSQRWFAEHTDYLKMMANEGIDLGSNVGNFENVYQNMVSDKGWGAIMKRAGVEFDKAFNEKTFASFMPQQTVTTFRDAYSQALKQGLDKEAAQKLAGETTKNYMGLIGDVARGKVTQDTLNAVFFAPRFRESLINLWGNTAKALTTEFRNPAFAKNRKLFVGMVTSFVAYNLLNKQLNGNYMFQNESGKEFDLKIPIGGDKYMYIGFMPSLLSFVRNMASGGIALAKGDLETTGQKFGSLFSIPIKATSEVISNSDYFGRPIYQPEDAGLTKLGKIGKYLGLNVNHPYVRALYELTLGTEKPTFQLVSQALELPFKFGNRKTIESRQFWEAMDEVKRQRAQEVKRIKPTYDEAQKLLEEGKLDEAQAIVDSLNDEDYEIYKDLRTADKRRATIRGKAEMFGTVKQVQDLLSQGREEEAQEVVDSMTDEEYRLYNLAKQSLKVR